MIIATSFRDASNKAVPVVTTAWSVQALDPKRVVISFIQNGSWRTEVADFSIEEFEKKLASSKWFVDLR